MHDLLLHDEKAIPRLKRLPTTTDTPGDIIAVAIMAMATTAHIMAMATTDPTTATDGPIMVMDMGVAGGTETGLAQEHRF